LWDADNEAMAVYLLAVEGERFVVEIPNTESVESGG